MMEDKLLIVDCDGVLYHPSELNINAMVYAFNDVCDDLRLIDEKFNYIENCTRDKSIKGFYNYIDFVARKANIPTEDFILKMVEHIDYSGIKPDSCGILQKMRELRKKYTICICTNNHLAHLNKVLRAKFNINADDFPFEIFDMRYVEKDGMFYSKESPEFITKLEHHFNISTRNFILIDDNPKILEKVASYGSKAILVTDKNRLNDILQQL